MADHLTPDALEAYVTGALEGDAAEQLEQHVARCTPCAEALVREARLEVVLSEVARTIQTRRGRRRSPPPVWWLLPLAAAAAAALFLGRTREPVPEVRSALTGVVSPLAVCVRHPSFCERPSRHGIATVEASGLEVPRYEEMTPALMSLRERKGEEP